MSDPVVEQPDEKVRCDSVFGGERCTKPASHTDYHWNDKPCCRLVHCWDMNRGREQRHIYDPEPERSADV